MTRQPRTAVWACALMLTASACAGTAAPDHSSPRPTTGPVTTGTPGPSPEATEQEYSDRTYPPPIPPPAQVDGDVISDAPVDVPRLTAAPGAVTCPAATSRVADAAALTEALSSAAAGTVIELADGIYPGNFGGIAVGTAERPIWVCGGRGAVLDGGSIKSGYTFYLQGIRHWRLVGFTVRGGQKGVMVDSGTDVVVQGLAVTSVGDEAIHLRSGTTASTVRDNEISDTGQRRGKFGEGVYVGSASSNWCTYSSCRPDRSNGNAVVGNIIRGTTSEAVDIKEGTQGGLLQGNTFDGSGGLSDADSWVDVKGNGWTIADNTGVDSPVDGFQVHSVLDGWGTDNTFVRNTAEVNGSGFGFNLTPVLGNVVSCDNQAVGASEGLTNVDCE